MDIGQYQPSPKTLVLSNMFCNFFGKQPLYYSFDLGNRVIPVTGPLQVHYPISVAEIPCYKRVVEHMVTSHNVTQLVGVVEEALRCFPDIPYNSEECSGLIAGLCGGRAMTVMINQVVYRAIVLIAGVVWLDKLPQVCLEPDGQVWDTLAKCIEIKRSQILRERALLKNLFR